MQKKIDLVEYIEANTLRCEVSYRGGGIEIDISTLLGIDGARMSAYQNYLGGGITGAICTDTNIKAENDIQAGLIAEMADALKRYFYGLNNGGGDEYMQENITGADAGGFERLQKMPKSAY